MAPDRSLARLAPGGDGGSSPWAALYRAGPTSTLHGRAPSSRPSARRSGEAFGTNGDSLPIRPSFVPHSGTRMVRSLLGQRLGTTTWKKNRCAVAWASAGFCGGPLGPSAKTWSESRLCQSGHGTQRVAGAGGTLGRATRPVRASPRRGTGHSRSTPAPAPPSSPFRARHTGRT